MNREWRKMKRDPRSMAYMDGDELFGVVRKWEAGYSAMVTPDSDVAAGMVAGKLFDTMMLARAWVEKNVAETGEQT